MQGNWDTARGFVMALDHKKKKNDDCRRLQNGTGRKGAGEEAKKMSRRSHNSRVYVLGQSGTHGT